MALQDFFNTGDDSQDNTRGAQWNAQTFTAGASYTITSVNLRIFRTGSPGTCTIGIYGTTGGKPSGAALASGSFDGDAEDTTAHWKEITLGAGTDLTSGTQYAIVMSCPTGSAGNLIAWRMDTTSPSYAGGAYNQSTDSGANWTTDTAIDFMFETYSASSTNHNNLLTLKSG